ncbi:MAG: hypothetical protein PW735_02810 [Acidobacteriaceae bacterium]|nr:hypothetical protein [Acidobacteriaceae bacterium]
MKRWLLAGVLLLTPMVGWAQASALPSATPHPPDQSGDRGRKLLEEMVTALGGETWLHRTTWMEYGKGASFYKGQPNPYVSDFEEYFRLAPYGQRVVIVSKQGVFIPTSKRDVAEVWTPTDGYEVTYRGKKALPQKDVDSYRRNRAHSLETVVSDWLKQPGIMITYDGTDMVERHLADKVTLLTASNDAVSVYLDERTHLPLSRSFQYRNETYRDFDTDVEQYDDWHVIQGIATPMTVTRLLNGDVVAQRFITKVEYTVQLAPDLFDPDRPLEKKAKK